MISVIYALLPIFALIGLGLLLRRSGLAPEEHWVSVEQFSYWLLFPALLITTLAKADVPAGEAGAMALTLISVMSLMTVGALLLRKPMARRWAVGDAAFTSVFQGSVRWHGFIALAVALNLYGEVGVALVAVALAALAPLANGVAVAIMARYGAACARAGWGGTVKMIAQNPLIWGCIIGVALNVTNTSLWPPLETLLDLLGLSALGVGMLAIGAALRIRAAREAGAAALLTMFLKLVVAPALCLAIGLGMGLTGATLVVAVICAAVPSAMNGFLLARKMGGDAPLYAAAVTLQTGAALITMPIWIAIAQALAGP
jgi:malonate transporter